MIDLKLKAKSPDFAFIGDPDWIQTNDPKLRRFVLYSAELPDRTNLSFSEYFLEFMQAPEPKLK